MTHSTAENQNSRPLKILVTGAKGFVGRNLTSQLKNIRDGKARNYPVKIADVFEYDIDSSPEDLDRFCAEADFVFNLAGVNRPKDPEEFRKGNFGFASTLLDTLKKQGNRCPVMLSSSVQASLSGRFGDSEYGRSKKAGEELFYNYGKETGTPVYVYRFPNIFGKWCRPNYNSAVATFCHNIANGLPITVNDPDVELDLLYIDDLVEEMINLLAGKGKKGDNGEMKPEYPTFHIRLGEIVEMLDRFKNMNTHLQVPNLDNDGFEKRLYSTFLSYLPKEKTAYTLKMNVDERGSFTELIRTPDRGQVSVNISKPGIIKGNHWHHSKNEKFIVVKGKARIEMRNLDEANPETRSFEVSGDKIEAVEMLPGWTHNIINLSDNEDLVTIMWCNETFDPERPDTFAEKV